jgi:excinuclease UvrABC ATPase subunit
MNNRSVDDKHKMIIDRTEIEKYFKLDEEITLSCVQGYQPRTIVEINDTYLVLKARIRRERSYAHLTLLVNAMLENGFREITDSDDIRIFVTQRTGVPRVQGGNDRRAYYAIAREYLNRRQLPNVAQPQPHPVANGLDVEAIIDDVDSFIDSIPDDISETEREALIKIRVGQGVFRQQLLNYWNNSCSVTECRMQNVLIASHIKPWRDCNGAGEKLDVMNGLLLIPNLDALFDKGFISFDDDGKIIISSQLSENDQERLGVNENMELREIPNERRTIYLEYHRKNIFKNE